jgi:hypothetical protein
VLLGEAQVREELVEVLLQMLHGRGVPGPEAGDQGVPAAKAGRVIRRQGTCRLRRAGLPSSTIRGAPRGQVVQEHHLDIRALAGAEAE